MNNKYKILKEIPKYKLFRYLGRPKKIPLNLTIGLTYRCNSRCKTCNIYNNKVEEFSLEEYDETFKKLGEQPYWFVLSGGEPFLRNDIVEICQSIYTNCKPGIINIPTNGILYDKIQKNVEEIVNSCKDTQIIINISFDGIKEKHDEIRCVKDNYDKTIKTFNNLKNIKKNLDNLEIGIHTVISRYNVKFLNEIYDHFSNLNPDSYITEIAEERVELGNIGKRITPSPDEYEKAIDYLISNINKNKKDGISKITNVFRLEYYDMVKRILKERKQIIPCYAGYISGQIAPNGDVWECCVKADVIGNLRENDYDFKKIWFGKKAELIRNNLKECYCPLASASYTNMLLNFPKMMKIGYSLIIKK